MTVIRGKFLLVLNKLAQASTACIGMQMSAKGGNRALYDKRIKIGTPVLDIMGNIFQIRGNL